MTSEGKTMDLSRDEQPVSSILMVDDTPADLNLLCGIIKERYAPALCILVATLGLA